MIPKLLHQIWIGPDPPPVALLDNWHRAHPHPWAHYFYDTYDWHQQVWITAPQMAVLARRGRWEGVADLMRYELLWRYGGIYLDADLTCERPLDDWLLDLDCFACYESEQYRPHMIANGVLGARMGHGAIYEVIQQCQRLPLAQLETELPWKTVGPQVVTDVFSRRRDVTILPSVLFLPQHYCAPTRRQSSLVYASHAWTTTRKDATEVLPIETPA